MKPRKVTPTQFPAFRLEFGTRLERMPRRIGPGRFRWLLAAFLVFAATSTHAATFIVEQATDAALRDAVILANQTPGPDRIEFADGITSIAVGQGQIEIFDSLVIAGPAGGRVTISGGNEFRIFALIDPGEVFPVLELANLVIEGGATIAPGTELANDLGNPDCSVNTGNGGAICSETTLRLQNVTVRNSRTSGATADGGGVWAASTIDLVASQISNNAAQGIRTEGGGIASDFGTINCNASRIVGNAAIASGSRGGGVSARGFSAANCTIANNQSEEGGGVFAALIDLFESTVANNTASMRGGGMLATTTSDGDGQSSMSSLIVLNSTISGNQASDGGGIFAIAGDQADLGILNATITANQASDGAGGVALLDAFEFIFIVQSKPSLQSDPRLGVEPGRLVGKARVSPGVFALFEPEIISSIVSGNLTGAGTDPDLVITPSQDRETVPIQQNNLIGNAAQLALAPLADNGCAQPAGARGAAACAQTHRVISGSAAIDAGANLFELEFDQRGAGFPRVLGSTIDIGAYEFGPLVIADLSLAATLVHQGGDLIVSWNVLPGEDVISCTGTGLPGTTWNSVAKAANGEQLVDTSPLAPGQYTVGLSCTRDNEQVAAAVTLTVLEPLAVFIAVEPGQVPLGEPATVTWGADPVGADTSCSAESLPPLSAWTGPVADSGTLQLATAAIPPGTYELSLTCQRFDFVRQASATLTVTDDPLEILLDLSISQTIIGDDVIISWTATPDDDFTTCTGFGLDGTGWNEPHPNQGEFVLETAALEPGTFEFGLGCTRPGQAESVVATLVLEPLSLDFSLAPATLIRGEDLTVSWSGTDGMACTGSGLPGTAWDGGGKPASGTQVVDTAPLAPDTYSVRLDCERRGVPIAREAEVVVLVPPADLEIDAAMVDMGLPESDFVEFAIADISGNPAFDLGFAFVSPPGYEVAGVFRRAVDCSVSDGQPADVTCDTDAVARWQCTTTSSDASCSLTELPPSAVTGLVVELRGQGQQDVSATVGASNAESRTARIQIGTGETP